MGNTFETEKPVKVTRPILGHVNLMTDTLIANANVDDLRAIVRALLATNPPSVTLSFNTAAKQQLLRRREQFNGISNVFIVNKNNETMPTPVLDTVLAYVRTLYGAGMGFQSIDVLTSIIRATLGFTWDNEGVMANVLAEIDADISQAIQSCREEIAGDPDKVATAKESLRVLLSALGESRKDIEERKGEFPFERGLANAESLRC